MHPFLVTVFCSDSVSLHKLAGTAVALASNVPVQCDERGCTQRSTRVVGGYTRAAQQKDSAAHQHTRGPTHAISLAESLTHEFRRR